MDVRFEHGDWITLQKEDDSGFKDDPAAEIQRLPWSQPRPPDRALQKQKSDRATALVGESPPLCHSSDADETLLKLRYRLEDLEDDVSFIKTAFAEVR